MLIFLLSVADEAQRDKVEEIYRKYHVEMFKVAMCKLRGRPNQQSEAEEALQNAFLKIIEYYDSIRFDESEACLRAYYLAIVTNEAINILKRHTEHICIEEIEERLPSNEDFLEQLCLQTEYAQVVQAIADLDDRYSIPLQLKYVEQLSVDEISALLDQSVKTVYTNISRGKSRLLKQLKLSRKGYGA